MRKILIVLLFTNIVCTLGLPTLEEIALSHDVLDEMVIKEDVKASRKAFIKAPLRFPPALVADFVALGHRHRVHFHARDTLLSPTASYQVDGGEKRAIPLLAYDGEVQGGGKAFMVMSKSPGGKLLMKGDFEPDYAPPFLVIPAKHLQNTHRRANWEEGSFAILVNESIVPDYTCGSKMPDDMEWNPKPRRDHTGCPLLLNDIYTSVVTDHQYYTATKNAEDSPSAPLGTIEQVEYVYGKTQPKYIDSVTIWPRLENMWIKTSADTTDFKAWNSAVCPATIDAKLNMFSLWRGSSNEAKDDKKSGLYMLFTNCYPPPGTVGLAWVGTVCRDYSSCSPGQNCASGTAVSNHINHPVTSWIVFAHEHGHNFGSDHYNGIMAASAVSTDSDFDDPSQTDMCTKIDYIIDNNGGSLYDNCFSEITCSTGLDCPDGYTCNTGNSRCLPGSATTPTGSACTDRSECQSGVCANGICCSTDCGRCGSCATGTCALYSSGTDPDDECGMCRVCDGSGDCMLAAVNTDPKDSCSSSASACGFSGVCDGAGECKLRGPETLCRVSEDASCDPEEYCSGTSSLCPLDINNCDNTVLGGKPLEEGMSDGTKTGLTAGGITVAVALLGLCVFVRVRSERQRKGKGWKSPSSEYANVSSSTSAMTTVGTTSTRRPPPTRQPPPSRQPPPTSFKKTVRALYAYEPQGSDELRLVNGKQYTVLREEGDWYFGSSSSGEQGLFPANFVEESRRAAPAGPPSRARGGFGREGAPSRGGRGRGRGRGRGW